MKEVAERLNDDTDALLERWEGRPDRVIEDVFKVRDLETKDVSELNLTSYQRQFVHAVWYGDASTVNVLKGRRTGYSFIACATILLAAMTTPHGFFAITGPSKSQAKDRIEDIYDLMEWAKVDFNPSIDNRDEIEFANGATVMAFSGNPDTSRGADSADILYIDEMDFLEDQEESMRAFSPFVALGDAKTIEISTPKLESGIFMQDQKGGSPDGENGIIAIDQPAFENPEDIDPKQSLLEQDVEPVMPYLNVEKAERDRARDPDGFRQEYLCEPVENQYRFFDEDTVNAAVNKGSRAEYRYGPTVGSEVNGRVIMAVDFAGGGSDETAVCIVEHDESKRRLRYHEVINDAKLDTAGIKPANSRNPSAVASRIHQLYKANDVDQIITDATNMGEGFDSEIRETIGRGINSFNFSDRDGVEEMMEDMNYGFHNGQITLVDDEKLRKQILAIIKDKKNKGSTPRFSGKDHAPEGRDDLAIALALASYPPNLNTGEKTVKQADEDNFNGIEGGKDFKSGNLAVERRSRDRDNSKVKVAVSGSSNTVNRRSRRYNRRHDR